MTPEVLSNLIDEFHERPIPILTPRRVNIKRLSGKANVVIGMRRAGKTWFCYQTMQELLAKGIAKERILYLNFEDDRLLPFVTADFQMILDVYFRKFPAHKDMTCYFYFDEMQRIPGWDHFVRRLLDTENIALIVTGSSSKLLSTEIASSIRGRSMSTEIFPFSFTEYLAHHQQTPAGERVGSKGRAALEHALESFIAEGGFPEVQSVEESTRMEILRDYIDVVLLRDVIERYRIGNVAALRALLDQALRAPTARLSVNRIYKTFRSQGIACTKNDLYDFLNHLTEAYLLYTVPIYSRSERIRQVNPAKVYAIDTGLLEAVTLRQGDDRGALLENLIFLHLRRQNIHPSYYVTQTGREVDFVYRDPKSKELCLLQVCWTLRDPQTRLRKVTALEEALKELRIKNGSIVTFAEAETPGSQLRTIPAWRFVSHD